MARHFSADYVEDDFEGEDATSSARPRGKHFGPPTVEYVPAPVPTFEVPVPEDADADTAARLRVEAILLELEASMRPQPEPEPEPEPELELAPEPEPEVEPEPTPEPEAESTPEPEPTPETKAAPDAPQHPMPSDTFVQYLQDLPLDEPDMVQQDAGSDLDDSKPLAHLAAFEDEQDELESTASLNRDAIRAAVSNEDDELQSEHVEVQHFERLEVGTGFYQVNPESRRERNTSALAPKKKRLGFFAAIGEFFARLFRMDD